MLQHTWHSQVFILDSFVMQDMSQQVVIIKFLLYLQAYATKRIAYCSLITQQAYVIKKIAYFSLMTQQAYVTAYCSLMTKS